MPPFLRILAEDKWIITAGPCFYIFDEKEIKRCKAFLNVPNQKQKPDSESDSVSKELKKPKIEENVQILAIDVCQKRNFIAICNSLKQLLVFDGDSLQIKHNFDLIKQATVVTFCHLANDILVADRSGNVTRFNMASNNKNGEIILGHVSIIFDMLITLEDNRVITCDRDEKIRISRYPNAYNIENFCLGHTKYVHTLTYLKPDKENFILISGGGDGLINFWNLKDAQLITSLNCSKFLENYENIQIKKILILDQILIAIFENISSILLLNLSIKNENGLLKIDCHQNYSRNFTDFPLDIEKLSENYRFLVIFESKIDPIKCYNIKIDNSNRINAEILNDLALCSKINKNSQFLDEFSSSISKLSSMLPKLVARTEDYVERKKKK